MKKTKSPSTKSSTKRTLSAGDLRMVNGGVETTTKLSYNINDQWLTTTGYGRLGDGGVRDCD
jgi:hypothetical protein